MSNAADNGLAPVLQATGDGAFAIPAGYRCIGFCADTGGTVAFLSGGASVTPTVLAGLQYAAQVDAFEAGSDATGIYAFLIK